VSDTRWRQSSTRAQYFAEWLGLFLPIRQPYPEIKIESRPDKQFEFDLFDRIALDIARKDIDRNFVVGSIEHEWLRETGQAVRTTVQLEPSRVPTDNTERVALEFPDIENAVLFNDMPQIAGLPEQSLAFWIYLTKDYISSNLSILGWVGSFEVSLGFNNKIWFRRNYEVSASIGIIEVSLNLGEWYHVVTVGENTLLSSYQSQFYLNGEEAPMGGIDGIPPSGTPVPTSSTMFQFGLNFPGSLSFCGLLRNVRVYDRIITAAEAADLAADVDVRDGLVFHSNFIPSGTQDLYIDQPLAPKPIYETYRARAGFASGTKTPVIVRDYDYDPSA